MRHATTMTALLISLAPLLGCYEVELEVPVVTQVAVVDGNPILNKAGARLFGQLLEPVVIDDQMGLSTDSVMAVTLEDFELHTTMDSVAGEEDTDDLTFVDDMVVYIRSVNPDTRLKAIAVAWYYAGETDSTEAGSLQFETDPGIDLLPYLEEGFELFSESSGSVPEDDVSIEGVATFSVLTSVDK